MNITVVVLSVLCIILFLILVGMIMRPQKSESFSAGCKGQKFMTADNYNKEYPYYGDDYFKPLTAGKSTNLEGVPSTSLYTSLY